MTIGIPTFNREISLERAVEAACCQDYPHIEVIVCDNGASDAARSIVERASDNGLTARYFRHEYNLGMVPNFRFALDVAAGEYFMWLADDDWIASDYVTSCVKALREHGGSVLAAGQADYIDGTGRVELSESPIVLLNRYGWLRVLKYLAIVGRNGVFHGVTRTEILRRAPLPDVLAGDWIHVAGLAAVGTVQIAPTTIRRSSNGISNAMPLTVPDFAQPLARCLRDHIRTSVAFAGLPRWQRSTLVYASSLIVYYRFGLGPVPRRVFNHIERLTRRSLSEKQNEHARSGTVYFARGTRWRGRGGCGGAFPVSQNDKGRDRLLAARRRMSSRF